MVMIGIKLASSFIPKQKTNTVDTYKIYFS